MRGWDYYYRYNRQDSAEARKFVREALKIDKEYSFAYVLLGFILLYDIFAGSRDVIHDARELNKCAYKAIELNDSFDLAHALLGYVYLLERQHDKSIVQMNRAVALNPNGADAHAHLAFSLNLSGKPEKAIDLMKRAFRLNPIPPPDYFAILANAYRMIGQYLKAIEACKKAISKSPEYVSPYITMAASYSLLEQYEKAHETVTEILRINPNLSIDNVTLTNRFKQKADLDNLLDALRRAGLPERSWSIP